MSVKCYRKNDSIVTEVSDNGAGINLSEDELFSPFVTTKPGGLGMGLAISARIIGSHEGSITAESGNKYTVFKVTLPEHAS